MNDDTNIYRQVLKQAQDRRDSYDTRMGALAASLETKRRIREHGNAQECGIPAIQIPITQGRA